MEKETTVKTRSKGEAGQDHQKVVGDPKTEGDQKVAHQPEASEKYREVQEEGFGVPEEDQEVETLVEGQGYLLKGILLEMKA